MKNTNPIEIDPKVAVEINQRKSLIKAMVPDQWHRMVAFFIDAPILMVISAVLEEVLMLGKSDPFMGMIAEMLLASFLYHVITELSPRHASVGKIVMDMKVIRLDGKPLTFLNIVLRSFMRFFSWGFIGFSQLTVLFTPYRQSVHDFVTATLVVKNKRVQPTDIENLQKTANIAIPKYEKGIKIGLFAFNVFYFSMALLVAAGLYVVRQDIGEGYAEVQSTMKYIEDYYKENQKYPASLDGGPHKQKFNTRALLDVTYLPENGALVLKYDPKIGVKGAMYTKPVTGVYLDDPKKIIWVCGGTSEFLQSFLPSDCTTMLELEMEKIRHAPTHKRY